MTDLAKFKSIIKSANIPVSFCFNPAYDKQKNPIFWLKIQGGEFWELNIQITKNEFELFPKVKTARWDERTDVKIGKCLGSPTFWSCDGGVLTILVGSDAESWEFAIAISENVLDDLFKEIEFANKKYEIKDNRWLL